MRERERNKVKEKGRGVVYGDEERVSLGTVGRVGEKIIQSEFL